MNSKKKFRRNRNKTRNKRGGGPNEDAQLLAAVENWRATADQINELLDKGANVNARTGTRTPLHIACDKGNKETAMALLDRGADVYARNHDEWTPLHYACVNGHMELAMTLVDRGAEVDARNDSQRTPLHLACYNGHTEVAMALVERGADIDAIDAWKRTPLHHACDNKYRRESNMEVAMALVKMGADIEAKDDDNKTPLEMSGAAGFGKLALRNAAAKYKKNKDKLLEPEKKETPIKKFVTTKNNWKIYLDDEHAEEFENLNGKYKVEFDHGTIYEGDWKDNKKHGKGKLISNNGTTTLVYEGDYQNDKIHGKGKIKYRNDEVYEGEWEHGKMQGKGKSILPNGNVYEGDFVDGKQHGKGKYTFADGSVYDGYYENGKMHGKGTFTYADGQVYEGDWEESKRHGKGKAILANGEVYEGDWKDNKMHGKGKYTRNNGDTYEGDFKDDKFNGKGIFKHKELNSVHEGEFKHGAIHGIGKYTDANGVYEGEYDDEDMVGIFKVTYKNKPTISVEYDYGYVENAEGELYNFELQGSSGRMADEAKFDYFKGKIENGLATGKAIFTPPYSRVNNEAKHLKYIGNIVNSKREGQGILKYKNKKSNKVIYKDDKLIQGEQGEYDYITVGDIYFESLEGKIENGLASGNVYITEHGDIEEYSGDIVNNVKHGKGYCYYKNDFIYDGDWENDKPHGNGKGTYDDAIYEGQWVENKREGQGKLTYTKGEEKDSFYEGEWKNDKWHGKGKVIFSTETYDGDWIENKRHGKGRETWTTGAKKGSFYEGEWKNDRKNGYGVYKYENAYGCCPAGSTYEGYWENGNMETKGNEVSKLTWPAHDSSYPDKSTACGLRSFEGKWKNDIPETPRAGYEDIPIALENWGNYIWEYNGRVLLNQAAANAYEVHQKGRKMKEKLGPVIEYIKHFDVAPDDTRELIQNGSPQNIEDEIFTIFVSLLEAEIYLWHK